MTKKVIAFENYYIIASEDGTLKIEVGDQKISVNVLEVVSQFEKSHKV